MAQKLESLDLSDRDQAQDALAASCALDSEEIEAIRKAAFDGFREGWLCPKENGGIKFGRPAKELCGFTVDAVWMAGPGPKHRHPNGEIDLCFKDEGDPTFDGRPEGWTVYGPDTTHVPTVRGGSMLILYFLPGGAIEFL
ncbi:MAG: DUF4863 family protein [Planctomycetota bacterium]